MSKEIGIIKDTGNYNDSDLQIISYCGPDGKEMIQLTQGFGGSSKEEPGFIQVTYENLKDIVDKVRKHNWEKEFDKNM